MATGTRDRILASLRTLLATGGTSAATLENVAAAAGVSKGGLLYHFPSKRELYRGLLESAKNSVAAELGELGGPIDVVRAYLNYTAPRDEEERGFIVALINALREDLGDDDDALRTLFAEIFSGWEEPVRAAIGDPVLAEIVLQVGNGWYLSSIAGLRLPESDLLTAVIDDLIARVESAR